MCKRLFEEAETEFINVLILNILIVKQNFLEVMLL